MRTKPSIRFKYFTDDWEQRKVGDVITEVSRSIEMNDDQLYQLVTVKRHNEGIVSRGFFYGKDILVKNYYEIHAGDYLISKRQLVHGANGQVPESLDGAIVSNEYMTCIGNEMLTAEFLTLLSKTANLKKDFFLSSYGVDIEKLVFDVNDWKKRSLVLPKIEEQKAICIFFNNLDNLITLHQRKCDETKELKKYMLQKMFPKKGEKKPEIRFSGFTGDWEQRKFEEIFSVSQGLQIPISERFTEGGDNRYFYITNEFLKDSCDEAYYIESPSESVICDEDDILMTRTGNTGMVVTDVKGCFHNNFFKIKYDKEAFSKRFICYLLSSPRMQKVILNSAGSSTIPDLSHKNFYKIKAFFPSTKNEQDNVGEFFYQLDNLITLHQRKCDELKEVKKYMLQNMFPKEG